MMPPCETDREAEDEGEDGHESSNREEEDFSGDTAVEGNWFGWWLGRGDGFAPRNILRRPHRARRAFGGRLYDRLGDEPLRQNR